MSGSQEQDQQVRDPFDPAALRVQADFSALTPVKRLLTTVPLDKPRREAWVRVHPAKEYTLRGFPLKVDRDTYLVSPDLGPELRARPTQIYTAITRQGDIRLWPVGLPGPDGKHNPWHASAMMAAEQAKTQWVRLESNVSAGYYEVWTPKIDMGEPQWPEESFGDLLRVACSGGKLIDSLDHIVLRQLRGEV